MAYSPWGREELDTTEQLHSLTILLTKYLLSYISWVISTNSTSSYWLFHNKFILLTLKLNGPLSTSAFSIATALLTTLNPLLLRDFAN